MPCDDRAALSDCKNCCLIDSLCDNINNVVTIYTEGCRAGSFTGLLVNVSCECVKLVTMCNPHCCPNFCNFFGKITVIPIDQIVAVTNCNVSV